MTTEIRIDMPSLRTQQMNYVSQIDRTAELDVEIAVATTSVKIIDGRIVMTEAHTVQVHQLKAHAPFKLVQRHPDQ